MLLVVLLIPLLAEVHNARATNNLPAFIKQCKNDTAVSLCSRRALEELRPYLAKGVPKLHLPPIEPLVITSPIVIDGGEKGLFTNLTNVVFTGAGDFEVLETSVKLSEHSVFGLKLKFPLLVLSTDPYVRGTLFDFTLNGTGTAVVNITNVVLNIVLNGENYDDGGREFIKWQQNGNADVTYSVVFYTELKGFFSDQSVTDRLKLTINKHADKLGVLFQAILASIPKFIVEAVNRVYADYPSNALYA